MLLAVPVEAAVLAERERVPHAVLAEALQLVSQTAGGLADARHRLGLAVVDWPTDRGSRRDCTSGRRRERCGQADDARDENDQDQRVDDLFHAPMVLRGVPRVNCGALC